MDKKIAIIAVAVVAIVIIAAFAVTMLNNDSDDDTIYWLAVPPVNQKDQIAQGLIDGGVSWEPYCSDSILSGDAHALMWSGEFWPNHPCCVVAVNADFAEDNPVLVARTIAAHMEATDWILDTIENKDTNAENYTNLLQMGAAFSGRNTTVVAASLEHMTLLYEMNEQFKNYLVNFTKDFIDLNQTSNAKVTERGYSSVEDFVDTFVNDSYMTAAATLSKTDTIVGTVRLGYLNGDLHQFARVVATNVTMWDGTAYQGKNLFTQYGVQITSPSPYANGPAVMLAFDTDAIDMGYLGSPPAIVKHLNVNTDNSDIRIVAQVNVEGSAIIVSNDILSIADLNGKTVATPGPGSIQHLMLLAFAKEYGFTVMLYGTYPISGDYEYMPIENGAAVEIIDYLGSGGNVIIPDTIDERPVTSIGGGSFYKCTSLTSVTIPDSVTIIGREAFSKCNSLISVTIGNNVTSIGYEAFYKCTGLTSINIPESVTSIDILAFYLCTSLTSIDVDADNMNYASIDGVVYNKALTTVILCPGGKNGVFSIPNGPITIGEFAFGGTSLTSVIVPDSFITIGTAAFYSSINLVSVIIGNKVNTIGEDAFYSCINLTSVTIGNNVTIIGDYAFDSCVNLASMTIPNSVNTIGKCSFKNCTSISDVIIGDTVTTIGTGAFYKCSSLSTLYFLGNAPSCGGSWISGHDPDLVIYYSIDATGFTTPIWQGVPAYPMVMMPSAPRDLTAVAGDACANLTWSSPIYNGVDIIDYYVVYQDEVIIRRVTGLSVNAMGLTNGQAYTFIVAAHNSAGIGEQSYSVNATPYPIITTPDAPTELTTIAGNTQVYLNWAPPTDDGGASIDYYIVYQDGVDVEHVADNSTTITGLTNGQIYVFSVAAHNSAGLGPLSVPKAATPNTVPDAPTELTAIAGNGKVTLNWTAPEFDGGRAIDHYTIYQDGIDVEHVTGVSTVIVGLTNGLSYNFTVTAHNVAGEGNQSIYVLATPYTVPNAPTGLTITSGNGQVILNWAAPAFDGGSNVTGYNIYRGTSSGSLTLIATVVGVTFIDTNVTNGQEYYYSVSALNSAGESTPAAEASVTPKAPDDSNMVPILTIIIASIVAIMLIIVYVNKKRNG